jgi:hypothetical protein
MFYLIEFNNIESEETKQLQLELRGYPNGTILSYAINIKVPILSRDKWIVWIDKDIVNKYDEQYKNFSKINGIKYFIELDITKSIYDIDWSWDDNYIIDIFARFV